MDQPKTAFEVEDIQTRKNYIFIHRKERNEVDLLHSSRGANNQLITTFPEYPSPFPFGCKNSEEYFNHVYKKGLKEPSANICFLGWVNPETLQPLEDNND